MGKSMGIKFWNVQMIPWSYLMVNHMCRSGCVPEPPPVPVPVGTIKLIKSDGLVKIYNRPINVSELMLEFPKHKVCSSDSFYIGQKISALSEDYQLQLGHNYFLLPIHFFQSVLSFVTIASFAANSKNIAKASSCQLFDIQKTESGFLRIRVTDEFISRLMREAAEEEKMMVNNKEEEEKEGSNSNITENKKKKTTTSRVCTTPQLQKDYQQLVINGRSRGWKPKLEMIRETRSRGWKPKLAMIRETRSSSGDQKKSSRKVLLIIPSSFRVKNRSTGTGNNNKSTPTFKMINSSHQRSSSSSEPHNNHFHHHVPSSSTTNPPFKHKLKKYY